MKAVAFAAWVAAAFVFSGLHVSGEGADDFPESHADTDPNKGDVPVGLSFAELDLDAFLQDLHASGRATLHVGELELPLEGRAIDMRGPEWRAILIDSTTGEQQILTDVDLGTYRVRLVDGPVGENPLTATGGYLNTILALDVCNDLVVETADDQTGTTPGLHRVSYYTETCGPESAEDETSADATCSAPSAVSANIEESPTCSPTTLAGVPLTDTGVSALATGWSRPSTNVDILVGIGSDRLYYLAGTSNVFSRQAAVLNNAENNVFNPTVNIDLLVATQWTWTSGGATQSGCSSARGTFETEWRTDSTLMTITRDTTLNLYERDLSGGTVGCGWTPGVHNPTTYGYSLVQTKSRTSTEEYKTAAHELGHNMYGEHNAGEKWWDWSSFRTKGTIMATDMKTKNKVNKFTEGTDDDYNSFRIRDCATHKSTCITRMKNIP